MMLRKHLAIILTLILTLASFGVLAADPDNPSQATPAAAADIARRTPQAAPVSSLAGKIAEIIAREQEQVAELSARIVATGDEAEALDLQRRIHLVKIRAERDVLVLQLPEAREKAAPERIDRLKNAIAALDEMDRDMTKRLEAASAAADSRN